jgi:hypothetical protein
VISVGTTRIAPKSMRRTYSLCRGLRGAYHTRKGTPEGGLTPPPW